MKEGKLAITITIGIMCFILTMVIFIQVKTVSQTNISELEIMREDELKAEISTLKTKTDEVELKLKETKEKIVEYQDAINKGKETSELLEAELQETEDLLGKTTVAGEGIVVNLASGEKKILAQDLIDLVNLLKDAGAEAISINNKRIVYSSYIVDLIVDSDGINQLGVNGDRIVEPYVVKAIGNITHLESAIAQKKYGYIDTKVSQGKQVTLEKSDKITINAYKGNLDFEYVKEGE